MTLPVFPNATLLYCYWFVFLYTARHEIKKTFRDEVMTKAKHSAQGILKAVKSRLWLFYIGACTVEERNTVGEELLMFVDSRRQELGTELHQQVPSVLLPRARTLTAYPPLSDPPAPIHGP